MEDYIAALKALADPHRLRVFWLLAHIDRRICVAEAVQVLGASHYNASRHLSLLKKAHLVTACREGKRVYYTLNHDGGAFIDALLAASKTIPAERFAREILRCKSLLQLRQTTN
jgi:ArsR family transcriptional regulator